MKMQKRVQWLTIFTVLTIFSIHVIQGISEHASAALFQNSVIQMSIPMTPRLRPDPVNDRIDRLRDMLLLLIRPSIS